MLAEPLIVQSPFLNVNQLSAFKQYWSRPFCINDEIISFPMEKSSQYIHSFNMKNGILKTLNELKYPSWFDFNNRCVFACNPGTSEIIIATHPSRIHKINLFTKQWDIAVDHPEFLEHSLFEECMFVKDNQVHVIYAEFAKDPSCTIEWRCNVKVNSLNHIIFEKSEPKTFAKVGTSRQAEFLEACWNELMIIPLMANQQHKVYLINKENMKLIQFQGDIAKHIELSGDFYNDNVADQEDFEPYLHQNAWNGAVITDDNKIALLFDAWPRANDQFINILDVDKNHIRKSSIKSPSVTNAVRGYYFRATIVPNRYEVSLTVNGYYRKLIRENKLIPTIPFQLIQLIIMYYCMEKIFFLNICEERFSYAVLYLDQILNSTPQDNIIMTFKYTSR